MRCAPRIPFPPIFTFSAANIFGKLVDGKSKRDDGVLYSGIRAGFRSIVLAKIGKRPGFRSVLRIFVRFSFGILNSRDEIDIEIQKFQKFQKRDANTESNKNLRYSSPESLEKPPKIRFSTEKQKFTHCRKVWCKVRKHSSYSNPKFLKTTGIFGIFSILVVLGIEPEFGALY